MVALGGWVRQDIVDLLPELEHVLEESETTARVMAGGCKERLHALAGVDSARDAYSRLMPMNTKRRTTYNDTVSH